VSDKPITDSQIQHRFTVLTWAVGISAGLTIATLGMVVTLSYQLGQIAGTLSVLVGHVQLK
jgi:hypothetical protein